jgi:hypothetical protein
MGRLYQVMHSDLLTWKHELLGHRLAVDCEGPWVIILRPGLAEVRQAALAVSLLLIWGGIAHIISRAGIW